MLTEYFVLVKYCTCRDSGCSYFAAMLFHFYSPFNKWHCWVTSHPGGISLFVKVRLNVMLHHSPLNDFSCLCVSICYMGPPSTTSTARGGEEVGSWVLSRGIGYEARALLFNFEQILSIAGCCCKLSFLLWR